MKVEGSNEIATHVKRSGWAEARQPDNKTSLPKGLDRAGEQDAIVDFSRRSKDIQSVQRILQSEPDVRPEKVRAIKQKIQQGTYALDPDQMAEKILQSILDETP